MQGFESTEAPFSVILPDRNLTVTVALLGRTFIS
jgi:hypothetical protein